jgi:hypothetical protein
MWADRESLICNGNEETMQAPSQSILIPNESSDEDASRELVRLIRKLRWIGKDDEAKRLENKLRSASAGDCVLSVPSESD